MRLAIINLTCGGMSGGYKKYLKNILPRFAEYRNVKALLCISPIGIDIPKWFGKAPNVNFCTFNPLSLSYFSHVPSKEMATYLRKFAPDIIFLPVDRYIRFRDVPVVNMVQNMAPFVGTIKGDTLKEIFRKFIQRELARNSVRLANHTIAVSNFVMDFLTNQLKIQENKVSKIYHGLTIPPGGNCIRPVSIPIGWDRGFLFTSGSVRPARGLEDVIEALSDLKSRNIDVRLVIAGETLASMKKYRCSLERLVSASALEQSVCWAGNLKDEEMCWCYKRCKLFIMTSRVEACPNIALEAMGHGCLCVSTDSLPMPEFFRDVAIYYPKGNAKSLSLAIQTAFALNNEHKKRLRAKSKTRASQFSWDVCAEKTIDKLKETIIRNEIDSWH